MDQEARLHPDDLKALAAPAGIACRRPIRELLESDGSIYRPPEGFRPPSAFTGEDAPFYMSLLTVYVRELGPAFRLSEGMALAFDTADAGSLIKDPAFLPGALRNAKALEEALDSVDGERLLVSMILSSAKLVPFDDSVLYRSIFTQMMVGRASVSA